MAAQHWSRERLKGDTPCPGLGVAAVLCFTGCEKIPHIQGQRRSPSKIVGGAKSHLDSNPLPATDAQKAQTNLVCIRTQRPHRD